jgi:dTDP-4-amino-4,6-dideoxygalactose transaminase
MPIKFVEEPNDSKSNFWLNAILLSDLKERDKFLEDTNDNGIMTRPIWKLMNNLPIYSSSQTGNLENATWLENRIVNIPSSVRI